MKIISTRLLIREIHVKITINYLIPVRVATIKKTNANKDVEKNET